MPRGRLSGELRRSPTRYQPVERVAVGGMAEIWKADAVFEDGSQHSVAIKRVKPELEQNQPIYRSMFEDEARLGMMLRHPNIVRVYDARDIGGTFIMVMELVEGVALRDLIERPHRRKVGMPVAACLHIVRELFRALDYAHTAAGTAGDALGIIHRDVSPHNLLLGQDGAVKLADFGLANATVHETDSAGMVGGKLGYLAPEVIDQTDDDHRRDIFATGIVAWEMLTGRRLFLRGSDRDTILAVQACQVPSILALSPSVSPDVDDFIRSLLARNMADRPSHARACIESLDRLIEAHGPGVGANDIALMVGVHQAIAEEEKTKNFDLSALMDDLEAELNAFVAQAPGTPYDLRAMPLNPMDFMADIRSGPTSS